MSNGGPNLKMKSQEDISSEGKKARMLEKLRNFDASKSEKKDSKASKRAMIEERLRATGKKKASESGDLSSPSNENTTDGNSLSDTQRIDVGELQENILNEFYAKTGVDPIHKKMTRLQEMTDEGTDPVQAVESLGLDYDIAEVEGEKVVQPKYTEGQNEVLSGAKDYLKQQLPERVKQKVDSNIETYTAEYQQSDKTREDFDKFRDQVIDQMRLRSQFTGSLNTDVSDEELRNDLEAITDVGVDAWEDVKDNSYRTSYPTMSGMSYSGSRQFKTPFAQELQKARKAAKREAASDRPWFSFKDSAPEDTPEVQELEYNHELTMMSKRFAEDTNTLMDKLDEGFGVKGVGRGISEYVQKLPKTLEQLRQKDSFKKFQDKMTNVAAGDASLKSLSDTEFMFLQTLSTTQELLERNQDKVSVGAEASEAIGQSLGFMAEMVLTAGVGAGAGKAAAGSILRYSAGRLAPTLTTKLTAQASKALTHAAVQTTAMPSFALTTAEHMGNGKDFGSAVIDGYTDTYIEVLSEKLFTTPINKFTKGSAIHKFWNRTNSAFGKIKGLKSGVRATAEETSEEYFAATMNAWREGDHIGDIEEVGKFMADTREQSIIWMATSTMALGGAGVNQLSRMRAQRRFKYLGEALGPIKQDVDALLKEDQISFEELNQEVTDIVMGHAMANDVDPTTAAERATHAIMYSQKYYELLSQDITPIKEREFPAEETATDEASQEESSQEESTESKTPGEVIAKGKGYSIKRQEEGPAKLVFDNDMSTKMDKMLNGEALTTEELSAIIESLEDAKGKVKNKKSRKSLEGFLSDAKDLKDDLVSSEKVQGDINNKARYRERKNQPPIEPKSGTQQRVYDMSIGQNMAGSIQETRDKNGTTYQVFDNSNKKIGDYNTQEEASKALRDTHTKQVGSVQSGKQTTRSASKQGLVSDIVNGISEKFRPKKKWEPIMDLSENEKQTLGVLDQYKGNFDEHIATAIPGFRDVQAKVLNALQNMLGGPEGGLVYDIGGSEGGFAKTLSKQSNGKIQTINLDANSDMKVAHEATPVKGSRFVQEAFGEGFTERGTFVPRHVPDQKADVVHEAMTFQSIGKERKGFVDEVADNYLKPDGLFVTEEKLHPKNERQRKANEEKKDKDFTSQYYSEEQLQANAHEAVLGTNKDQASASEYRDALEDRFDFVEEYWDGGNFKGFVASNSKAKVDAFLNQVGNTDTAFSEKSIMPKKPTKKTSTQKKIDDTVSGKGTKKVTIHERVNEMTELKKKLRFEEKVAKKGAKQGELEYKQMMKDAAATIKEFVRSGRITSKQASVVISKMTKTNLANPVMKQRFFAYADKVFAKAENIENMKKADAARTRVRKAMKGEKDPDVKAIAGNFMNVDSRLVEDVNDYLDKAEDILGALRSSRRSGTDLKLSGPMANTEVGQWVDNEIERQEPIKEAMKAEIDMDILGEAAPTEEEIQEAEKAKAEELKENIAYHLNGARAAVKKILDTGKDPMTGEAVTLTDAQKKVVRDFMNIDMDLMSVKEAIKTIDGLRNFAINYTTNGMEASARYFRGQKMVKDISGFMRAHKFFSPILPSWMARHIASVPLLFENVMQGRHSARTVLEGMGLSDWIQGKSKAEKFSTRINEAYHDKFMKQNPNGQSFSRRLNVVERGMYAYVTRAMPADEVGRQKEFETRKQRISDSIDKLKEGNRHQKTMAEAYSVVYDKLLDDVESADVVEDIVDPINKEAVQWWRDRWNEMLPDLSRVSRDVYNKILSPEINYAPDLYRKVEADSTPMNLDENLGRSSFDLATENIFDKESSVLLEKRKFKQLPDDKYVSLDFDRNMHGTMQSAALDIGTAASTRQIEGFVNSPAFRKLFPDETTRSIVKARVNGVINNARGRVDYGDKQTAAMERMMAQVGQFGAARALGSMTMSVKQTIPVAINTLINSGGLDLKAMMDPQIRKLIDESGYAIAVRGAEQIGEVVPLEKQKESSAEGMGQIMSGIQQISNVWINKFLVKPDVFIARASWWTYYTQNLKKQGIDTGKIDWADHTINDTAATYAQDMVDRQQNVSDADLLGEFLRSRNPYTSMMRKMLFPFANFMLNQKMRMYTDVTVMASRDSTWEDKKIAANSLAGLLAEQTAFHAMGTAIRLTMFELAAKMMGYREPDEAFSERFDRYVSNSVGYLAADLISPLPVIDDIFIETTRKILNFFGDDLPEWAELPSRNYIRMTQMWGTYGVGMDVIDTLMGLANAAFGETYSTEYMGQKTERRLRENEKDIAKGMFGAYTLYTLGLLPAETAGIVRRMKQMLDKGSITEAQHEKYLKNFYESVKGRAPAGGISERNIKEELDRATGAKINTGSPRPSSGFTTRD